MRSRDSLTTFKPAQRTLAQGSTGSGSQTASGTSLVEVIWNRLGVVLAITVGVIAIACIYLTFAQRIYTSTSRLYVEENGPGLLAQGPDEDLARSEAYLFRQCQVLKSDSILQAAVELGAADGMQTFMRERDVVAALAKRTDVSVGKRDQIISIAVSSPYPKEASTLVNAIVASYQVFKAKQTRSTAAEVLDILQREKTKDEQLLDARLKEIVEFKEANGEMFFVNDRGENILMQNLADISEQLTKAKLNAASFYVLSLTANNRLRARTLWREEEAQVQQYEKMFESAKQTTLKLNSVQAEFQKLQQEADRTSKLCDLLDTRIKEIDVTRNGGAMNIQLLEPGKPEDHPTQPNKTVVLLTSAMFGFALGCGVSLCLDRLDHRIQSVEEVGKLLGELVLGTIPSLDDDQVIEPCRVARLVHEDPASYAAEAYRVLRTAVNFGWPRQSFKSILVTSPNRSEGKSSTCSNLAISMAKAGHKVLLIDADLREPVQHHIFNLPNFVGVSDVVDRGVHFERAVQQTDIEGLSLLPSGTLPANPAEIINSGAFEKMLQRLEIKYDYILIDSSPVLVVTDARILCAQADVTLLVLRANQTTRQEAEQAREGINGVGGAILGIVLNGVPRRTRGAERYGSNYSYKRNDYSVRERRHPVRNLILDELASPGHAVNGEQRMTD